MEEKRGYFEPIERSFEQRMKVEAEILLDAYELYNHYDHNIGMCWRNDCKRCEECYRFNSLMEYRDLRRNFPIDEFLIRVASEIIAKDPYDFSYKPNLLIYKNATEKCPYFIKDEIKDDALVERRRNMKFTVLYKNCGIII
jgi:hypothetical protein